MKKLFYIILIFFIVDCGEIFAPSDKEVTERQEPGCKTNRDCEEGSICVEPEGFCAFQKPNFGIYSVELIPPLNSGFIKEQFTGVSFTEKQSFDVTISAPLKIKGIVIKPDKNGEEIYPGFIVAVSEGKILGTNFISESEVIKKDNKGFELLLLPGVNYEITFIPQDEKIPDYKFVKKWSSSDENFQLILPKDEDYVYYSGVVILDEKKMQPIKGARVYGITEKAFSTKSITDENGIFKIIFPPETKMWTLRIEPTASSIEFPPLEYLIKKEVQEIQYAGEKNIFPIGPVPPSFDVTIQVLGQENKGLKIVKGAKVRIKSIFNNGLFNIFDTTDEDGIIRRKLFSGSYIISILPPVNNEFGKFEGIAEFGIDKGNQIFQIILNKRPKLYGKVLRPDGVTPVEGAEIIATFSKIEENEVQFKTITDSQGKYSLPVDYGIYNIVVISQKKTGLAKKVGLVVEVKEDTEFNIVLSRGTLLVGSVRDEKGVSVKDVKIEFFLEGVLDIGVGGKYGPQNLPVDKGTSYAKFVQSVSSAISNINGEFKILLPEINYQNPLIDKNPFQL